MLKTLRNRFVFAASVSLSTLAVGFSPAYAAVLIDNRFPELVGFVGSDFDNGSLVEMGEGFSLNAAANITDILWSGAYGPSNTRTSETDNFSVRLFTIEEIDLNGLITTTPLTTLTGSLSFLIKPLQISDDPTMYDVYFYTLSLPTPFKLGPGNYLLSIINDTSSDVDDDWSWTRTAQGNARFRFDAAEPWDQIAGGFYFAIEGEGVPAPVPTPALLPGLIGFGISVWRRRKLTA